MKDAIYSAINVIEIGRRIKLARTAARLSQEEFAKYVNTSVSNLWKWENGTSISFSNIIKVSDATGVPLDYFAGRTNELKLPEIKESE